MTETFRNPITESGADPFVVRFEERYYYVYSTADGVFVSHADNIHHLAQDGRWPMFTSVKCPTTGRGSPRCSAIRSASATGS